jgi:crotonobetaine/carnitine-CoA ligase
MNSGYYKNPEATAGLAQRLVPYRRRVPRRRGRHFFFVDRMKDAIRRRGENISSFEVEAEVARVPGGAGGGRVAVPSEIAEDEVMCAVAARARHHHRPARADRVPACRAWRTS